jgi:hypothetical protein
VSTNTDFDDHSAVRRASLSYMMAWTDALMWAISNRTSLDVLVFELAAGADGGKGPMASSVTMQASDAFDALGADPWVWMDSVPMEYLLQIRPDPSHWSTRDEELTDDELSAELEVRYEEIRRVIAREGPHDGDSSSPAL